MLLFARVRYDDAAKVVLVRAVEESVPGRIPPETLLRAYTAAGDPSCGGTYITRRAAFLVEEALRPYREVLIPADVSLPGPWVCVVLAFAVGLASNYLGPAERIHVVFNPIVLLVAWNVAVYAGLALRRMLWAHPTASATTVAPPRPFPASGSQKPASTSHRGGFKRFVLSRSWAWVLGIPGKVAAAGEDAQAMRQIARCFVELWVPVISPALGAWIRRLLHLCAVGLAAGAIVGMYVRGLFFAYHVVWRSTFVDDPGTIALALSLLLGPAAMLLGQDPPGRDDAVRLLSEQGDPAAPWIHLYAVTAGLFIVLPRALLAIASSRRLHRLGSDVQLDFGAAYYRDLLQKALTVSPAEREASIRHEVASECRLFAGRLAEIVCTHLYDARIAPRLREFRKDGGSLRELEASLHDEVGAFGPLLTQELPSAMHALEHGIAQRVRRLLGDDDTVIAGPSGDLVHEVSAASTAATTHLGDRVGGDMTTIVGSVVSASVAVAVGTVTGGFGEVLGVALLLGVLESGPVGWIVGALVGLVGTAAAMWVGRDAVRHGVKAVRLPSRVVKIATVSAARYERIIGDGRTKCDAAVREALEGKLDALAKTIADEVWKRLMPVVGEQQRPRVAAVDTD